MADIVIQQAIFRRAGSGPPALLARSAGFLDAWLSETQRLAEGFGDRPDGVRCPRAVFAKPLDKDHVAVVQVGDQPGDNGTPSLGFHVLTLPRAEYVRYFGDPFFIAEQFPPTWHLTDELPALTLPTDAQPQRTVAMVQRVLQRVKAAALPEDMDPNDEEALARHAALHAESPALLGGAQVLIDGGKLVFQRPEPDHGLLSGLWTLLPNLTRGELWPASFAFGNALQFDALVVPRFESAAFPGYTGEEQAAEYPQGRYELQLQTAAEAGDQHELDMLFARRSWNDTWRLAVRLLVVITVLTLASRLIFNAPPEEKSQPDVAAPQRTGLPPLTQRELKDRASTVAATVSAPDPFTAAALMKGAYHYYTREPKTP